MLILSAVSVGPSIDYGLAHNLDLWGPIAMSISQVQNKALNYHIWRVFPKDNKGFVAVVISVEPKHFNRNDMLSLATEINKRYTNEAKLKVALLDDAATARNFVNGRAEYPEFERAQKGIYYLNRIKCEEYIWFMTQGKRPKRETMSLKCPR
jgi:hypothetical protein